MASLRAFLKYGICPATSLAIGVWFGATTDTFKKNKSIDINKLSDNIGDNPIDLPSKIASLLPTVSAAQQQNNVALYTSTNSSNTLSKISSYGFPGADLLRTFDDYIVSYDRRQRVPQWVFEHLTHEKVKYRKEVNRETCKFEADDAVHAYFRSGNDDYKGSGFDRGHMAAAGNHRWSQTAMDQTFKLSNIAPQVGVGFNRHAWNDLERFVRHLTKKYTNVYVCTGPLYLPRKEADGKLYVKYQVIGRNNIAVPTHYFKVVLMEKENDLHLMSFVMPNQPLPENVELTNYLVPVDIIERNAGFLLFSSVPRSKLKTINGKTL